MEKENQTNETITWGLWLMKDKCWLGNDKGPNIYTDHELARAAATVATEMFDQLVTPYRIGPGPFSDRGEVTPRCSGEAAVGRIEGRVAPNENKKTE